MNLHKLLVASLAYGLALLSWAGDARGQIIERIEEEWELHVVQPDSQLDAPQVTMTMLPFGTDVFLQIDLNHGSWPEFSRGGIQVRACNETTSLVSSRLLAGTVLSQDAEILAWTQVVQKVEGGVQFGIENGSSTSFGTFGGPESFILLSDSQAGTTSLDAYTPTDSAANSGVIFARNRVAWLRFKKARIFLSTGDTFEWTFNTDVD